MQLREPLRQDETACHGSPSGVSNCGCFFCCTCSSLRWRFWSLRRASSRQTIDVVPRTRPLLIFSGILLSRLQCRVAGFSRPLFSAERHFVFYSASGDQSILLGIQAGHVRSLPVSSICRTSVAQPLTTMSRWVFGLDLQREVDQRWRPGTRLPKVRAQGCSHAERSNLRTVKEFSQTKGEVRATEGSRLVHFSFSGQSEWTSFSVQEDLCAERHTHKLPSGMSERTEVLSGTPRAQGCLRSKAQGCLFPLQGTRLLEVRSTRLLKKGDKN